MNVGGLKLILNNDDYLLLHVPSFWSGSMEIYKITRIVRALSLVNSCVLMRVS